MLHRLGNGTEFRVDKRQIVVFFIGLAIWLVLAFFFGVMAYHRGTKQPIEKKLQELGWLQGSSGQSRQTDSTKAIVSTPPKRLPNRPKVSVKPKHQHKQKHKMLPLALRNTSTQRKHHKFSRQKKRLKRRRSRHSQRKFKQHKVAANRGVPRRPRLAILKEVDKDASSLSRQEVLEDAKRFRLQRHQRRLTRRKTKALRERQAKQACNSRLSWKAARYTILLSKASRRWSRTYWRRRLRRKGYRHAFISLERRRKRRRVYKLKLGRFRSRTDALRCLKAFRKVEPLKGRIISSR